MQPLNGQVIPLVAGGFLPDNTPLQAFAKNAYGCTAKHVSGGIWLITLNQGIQAGGYVFLANAASSGLTGVDYSCSDDANDSRLKTVQISAAGVIEDVNSGFVFLALPTPNVVSDPG